MSKSIFRVSKDWRDFCKRLGNLAEKERGDCFELLAKYYLQSAPAYKTKLKRVWLLKEVPAKIRKHLNLPSQDEGIDLIAEAKEREYWAVQCKYKTDETKSLSRKELSTFTDLAFGICKNISLGLVCTSADRYSRKLKLHGDRLEFCAGDVWRALDANFFRDVRRVIAGREVKPKRKRPRSHQKRAIRNAVKHFVEDRNSRGKLISPCGTGKSLTGYWIAEALEARSILVAVPSLALVRQSLGVWAAEAVATGRQFNWICVCSDESVARDERDDATVLVQDLGVRVHTDPKEIAAWLRRRKSGASVVFTTYQSGKAIASAARLAKKRFDVGIFDEAHNTVGRKDALFTHLLHEENIKIGKRVFVTATERRYAGRSDHIVSMEDPSLFGDTFEMLSFKAALECKPPILSDYRIVTVAVTKDEIAELIDKNLFVKPDRGKWSEDVEAATLGAAVALRRGIQKHPIKHAVSFHSSIARAVDFKSTQDALSGAFPKYKRLETYHVSGKTPTAVRSRTMEEFETAKRALITNARCLSEGVDIPKIDCVTFADPRRGAVSIVQAVGRALRIAEGKKYGYIIIPIVVDGEKKHEGELRGGAFDSLLLVLRALAANDERIIEYFRSVSQGRRRRSGHGQFELEIPDGLTIDADEFASSIELRLWSRLAKLSWRPFEEAREFVRALGLHSQKEWKLYCKGELEGHDPKPADIPANPYQAYKDEDWINWGDWIGTGAVAPINMQFRPFREAREFVRALGLHSKKGWRKYCAGEPEGHDPKPDDIPADPYGVYKGKGWVNWGDWFGTRAVAPINMQFRPFREACEFVRALGLQSGKEWKQYCAGELEGHEPKPDDIPSCPDAVYKDKGWVNWGDWFGTGAVAPFNREFRAFRQARAFARTLGLHSHREWRLYCKGELEGHDPKPDDIPTDPYGVYTDKGWVGWGDWLGTGTVAPINRKFRSFRQARAFVQALCLQTGTDWKRYCAGELEGHDPKPDDIPANPLLVYKDQGWSGLGDWLGTGAVATHKRLYRPFSNARAFVRTLCLKNMHEWTLYSKGELEGHDPKPDDIPVDPIGTYRDKGWNGVGDWLGTGAVAPINRQFRSFQKARTFIRKLGLRSRAEWAEYCSGKLDGHDPKPKDIPAAPVQTYKGKGWSGWGDWLGTGSVANFNRQFRPFREALKFVRTLGLHSHQEWRQYCRGELEGHEPKPNDIPANPYDTYKDQGWSGLGDWLGTGTLAPINMRFRTFREARGFVRALGLKSRAEWARYCAGELDGHDPKPKDIPAAPAQTYKGKGWSGWGDWLGTDVVANQKRQFRSFQKARTFVRKLGLHNRTEWAEYYTGELDEHDPKPDDIPAAPARTYKDKGWSGWGDWLGTDVVANQKRQFRSFQKARTFVRRLGLHSQMEWRQYCKGELKGHAPKPVDIPANPYDTYKDKGWANWSDWLGKPRPRKRK